MFDADLTRHRAEFARAVRNKHYEFTDGGILFPKQGAFLGGVFETTINGRDRQLDANKIPTAGLNHALAVIVGGATQINPWHVALFSGNVTPQDTLTAANFAAAMTEFTGYSEATRVPYVEGTPAAGAVDNDASRAEFTITSNATLYGGALLSASAKGATTGEILACARFTASRGVQAGDTLGCKYSLALTSTT